MCNCLKIFVNPITKRYPDHFFNPNGTITFDLYPDEKFSKSKSVEELSKFDKITGDAVLGLSIPASPKNKRILKNFDLENSIDFDYTQAIPVTAFEGGVTLPQNRLVVKKIKEGYEIELRDPETFWREGIKNCKVCDLTWPDATYITATLVTSWMFVDVWAPPYDPYYWATIDFGGKFNSDRISTEDHRPLINYLYTLQQGFCKLGYVFRSPVLESDFGRRLYMYILKKTNFWSDVVDPANFGEDIGNNIQKTVNQDIAPTATFPVTVEFDNVLSGDASNFIGIGDYYELNAYPNDNILVEICTSLIMQSVNTLDSNQIRFGIEVKDDSGNITLQEESGLFFVNLPSTYELCVKTHIGKGYQVRIQITEHLSGTDIRVVAGSTFSVTPCVQRPYNGDTFLVSQAIDCDYTIEDILKGGASALGLQFVTDQLKKEVWAYIPFKENLPDGSPTEGFGFDPGYAKDWRGKIKCKSKAIDVNKNFKDRYLNIAWNDSGDAYIETFDLPADEPFLSRTIDLGADKGLNNAVEKRENPFFEPTAQVEFAQNNSWPIVPAMWDNTDYYDLINTGEGQENESFDIGPRLVLAYGATTSPNGNFPLNDTTTSEYGHAGMYPGFTSGGNDPYNDNLDFRDRATSPFNLYDFAHRKKILQQMSLPVEYIVYLSNKDYNNLEFFRFPYILNYNGKVFQAYAKLIKDFQPCKWQIGTPVEFSPIYIEIDCE